MNLIQELTNAYLAQPGHTLQCLELINALNVQLDPHQQLVHRRAQSQAARKDRTTQQSNPSAHHAWQGRILIRLELLSALNVQLDHHRQLVHRRAHNERTELTPRQPGRNCLCNL